MSGDYWYVPHSSGGSGGSGGGGDSTYLVVTLDDTLTNERSIAFNATNFTVTDAGANGTYSVNTIQNINSTASPTFASVTLSDLTASRLVATDAFSGLTSVASLTLWVAGADSQIVVANDGDGTITLSLDAGIYRAGGTDVAVADGGTGLSSYTTGDLLYASGTTTLAKLADVATGSVLVSGGVGAAPAWSSTPTVGGMAVSNATTPTYTLTDTTDGGSATWSRTDSSATCTHKNTVQEGGDTSGLRFDGSNDYADVPVTTAFNGHKQFTWMFWSKVLQDIGNAAYYPLWAKFSNNNAQRHFRINYRDVTGTGNDRLQIVIRSSDSTYAVADEYIINDGAEMNDGGWHLIVLTINYDTGVVVLYKDGAVLTTVTGINTSLTTYAPTGGNNIEARWSSDAAPTNYTNQDLDEAAIWTRALTADEVSDLWNGGAGLYVDPDDAFPSTSTPMSTNLAGLWHFDEGTGTSVADSSGNGLNVTLPGSPATPTWVDGIITAPGVDYTVTYIQSEDGGPGIRGKTTFGNTLGDTYINGKTTYFQIAGTSEITMDAANFYPTTNDGMVLGKSGNAWADAFWATGAVHNFGAGDYTVTHSTGQLAFSNTIAMSAGFVQNSVTAGITASTTQTQGQGALTKEVNEVSTVANTNDTVTAPAAVAGRRFAVFNNGANTLQIFPASGDNLGAGVDTAVALAAGSNVVYQAYDATNYEAI